MMRSESTNALGHPSETKLTFGVACDILICPVIGQELTPIDYNYKALSRRVACYQWVPESG
jgi:hypothetical protein